MATPAAETTLDAGMRVVLPGRGMPLSAGWDWVARGWKLFVAAPLMWIIALVILGVFTFVMMLVPILGNLVFQVLLPVLAGGLVVACRSLEQGGDFELEHLFAGFTRRFGPLAMVGVITLVLSLVIVGIFFLMVGAELFRAVYSALVTGDPAQVVAVLEDSVLHLLLAVLVALALQLPLVAAYWYAPALVVMHDVKPLAAMKESLLACIRNFFTLVVYSIVMLVAMFIAIIPFGLGMIVWVPLAITSTYVSYRQIFTEDVRPGGL
jgi:uncharacterized membrane protein